LGKKMPFFKDTIDMILLSHPHADHLNGLIQVIKRYKVKNLILTGVETNYAGYLSLLNEADARGVKLIFIDGKKDFKLGSITLDIIHPFESLQGQSFQNLNNSSIVFRSIMGSHSMLLSGDLEKEREKLLVEKNFHLNAELLKAGHHGSKTSNTAEFLAKIGAKYVFISCGINNPFKHPAAETIARMKADGMTVYRTDLDGNIEIDLGQDLVKVATDGN